MRTIFDDPAKLLVFDADLDPAGLSGDATGGLRAIRAKTAMQVSLILGERLPVLAENQVFDSPLVLGELLTSNPSDDAGSHSEQDAFLWLIANDYIRVRIHAPIDDPGVESEDLFTLRAACGRALANPDFRLSGWPRSFPQESREEAARYMMGASTSQPDPEFLPTINVITAIDDALRRSSSSERAVPVPMSLDAFIRRDLEQRCSTGAPGSYLVSWFNRFTRFAADVRQGDLQVSGGEPIRPFNLDKRSDWYRLIDAYRDANIDHLDVKHGAYAASRAIVDLAYNRKVALSVGAPFQREVAVDPAHQALVGGDPDVAKISYATAFLTESTESSWLTWTRVKELLEQGLVPNESSRFRERARKEIIDDLIAEKVTREAGGGMVHNARVHVAGRITAAGVGSALGAIVGGVLVPDASLVSTGIGAGIGAGIGQAFEEWVARVDRASRRQEREIRAGISALTAELATGESRSGEAQVLPDKGGSRGAGPEAAPRE